ncbi:MAG: hypothetical protein IPJ61_11780 [Tessaracoccus sp.]|uniref:hypothetical protein n=1 Tax=Tessaracoccus sp. TaxID=1971211 RepID=UPI001ED0EC8E|nr:hypothetical protein [Tessaracoccus sp.]MBK7821720.1 hypothetical protein [Tessaracoccus sp.]
MRVPIEKVPTEVRRRAARAVAAMTVEHLYPRLDRRQPEPRFAEEATPVYRPDLDEVAYWEFELEGLLTALPVPDGEAKEYDRGFILVATGAHDVPVPHFSLDLAPPSRQLEVLVGEVPRLVKLDALCYAAEDDQGEYLAHIGTMPPKLQGLPAELPRRLTTGYTTMPEGEAEDGERMKPVRVRRSREKPLEGYGPWDSWAELRKGYGECYRLHLAALAERAREPWEVEALTEKFGEGIHSGETRTVYLLQEGKYELRGPGADYVSAELNPQPLPPRLVLQPRADTSVKDTSFEVVLHYGHMSETLAYFIVPEGAPSIVEPTVSGLGPTLCGGVSR